MHRVMLFRLPELYKCVFPPVQPVKGNSDGLVPMSIACVEFLRQSAEISSHDAFAQLPIGTCRAWSLHSPIRRRLCWSVAKLFALQGDGQRKLLVCTAGHGASLGGVAAAVPGLLGSPRDYISA